MITRIQKWGNSQGIRIPKSVIEAVHWDTDEQLIVTAKDDKIIIERAERRKNIKELFADFDGEYTPVDMEWGNPIGEEVW